MILDQLDTNTSNILLEQKEETVIDLSEAFAFENEATSTFAVVTDINDIAEHPLNILRHLKKIVIIQNDNT